MKDKEREAKLSVAEHIPPTKEELERWRRQLTWHCTEPLYNAESLRLLDEIDRLRVLCRENADFLGTLVAVSSRAKLAIRNRAASEGKS